MQPLRHALRGQARDTQRFKTEDHMAFGFEVMRFRIAGDDIAVANLGEQRRFFRTHMQPWVEKMADTIGAHPRPVLYRALVAFTLGFMQGETHGLDILG